MRVKAVRRFYDGWENCVRKAGEVFETTRKRFEYWSSASLVVLANDAGAGDGEHPNLEVMSKAELLAFAEVHGVSVDRNMRKADIVSAIKEAMSWT